MERYGYCIFCDDIRNEPGGKLSFIGCYNAVMFVGREFPLALPKFCVHFYVFSPRRNLTPRWSRDATYRATIDPLPRNRSRFRP